MSKPIIAVVDAREPVWKSWARDTYTFGVLAGTALVTNRLMPPSGWINFMVATLWLLWMLARSSRHKIYKTADQARAWLDENYPTATPEEPKP